MGHEAETSGEALGTVAKTSGKALGTVAKGEFRWCNMKCNIVSRCETI